MQLLLSIFLYAFYNLLEDNIAFRRLIYLTCQIDIRSANVLLPIFIVLAFMLGSCKVTWLYTVSEEQYVQGIMPALRFTCNILVR